ncbi:MAG: endonuclease MutS2 [Firmicutes bacterium]|jgi:DNA mismatch repair protein MutS2|nr:endonuclease MutS2 [Bacillota bacterium]
MEKTRRILEFDKIKEQLRSFTLTAVGEQKASALVPYADMDKIISLQQETSEAVQLLLHHHLIFKGVKELKPSFQRAERGGILSPGEMLEIENFLKALESVRNFFSREEEIGDRFPRLFDLVMRFQLFPHLVSQMEKCLNPQGEIRDNASPLLSSLRVEERRLQEKIHRSLDSFLRNPHYQKYLQENIVTVRHDRYVLPVKQEFRSQFPGVVHDQSGSGVTLFMEPLPVLELNNRLREVKSRIEEEIELILRRLSGLVGSHYAEIVLSYEAYGELDFILARGKLSIKHRGTEPVFNDKMYISIVRGRHPLLPPDSVVPVDVQLGKDFNTLVITGPNTGGKTVTLKTIGLLIVMAQSGLHVPAKAGTELGVFQYVLADIGDEQDIEQSLSTFSGHMKSIIEILHKAYPPALILLDELGSGTDPSEGSALAMAVLDELHSRGVRTVATTHINELKVFAHISEGMENASMEFDPLTLSPTFRLLTGVPGQSNALTVAERLGMPAGMINKARSYMRKDFLDLEKVVSGLVEERSKLSRDNEKIEEMKAELGRLLKELEEEKKELQKKRREILRKAREEATGIVSSAQRKIDAIIKNLHKIEREGRGKEALSQGEAARKEIKAIRDEYRTVQFFEEEEFKPIEFEELKEGQFVYVKSLRSPGEVIRVASRKEIQVRVGLLKVNTEINDLCEYKKNGKYSEVKGKELPANSNLLWEKSAAVQRRLDLRGLNLEEAILRVDKHLDDALLAGLDTVEIIHGKGTGKLRSGLHLYLQDKKEISGYCLGGEGEGGSGVTIVRLSRT